MFLEKDRLSVGDGSSLIYGDNTVFLELEAAQNTTETIGNKTETPITVDREILTRILIAALPPSPTPFITPKQTMNGPVIPIPDVRSPTASNPLPNPLTGPPSYCLPTIPLPPW
jgi:hypothetical protein